MIKCFCDICKMEMIKDGKHYALAVRERCEPQCIPETLLYLEDICYDCYTDLEIYIKKRGYYNDRSKTD